VGLGDGVSVVAVGVGAECDAVALDFGEGPNREHAARSETRHAEVTPIMRNRPILAASDEVIHPR
jgi:hypothetical protein